MQLIWSFKNVSIHTIRNDLRILFSTEEDPVFCSNNFQFSFRFEFICLGDARSGRCADAAQSGPLAPQNDRHGLVGRFEEPRRRRPRQPRQRRRHSQHVSVCIAVFLTIYPDFSGFY